MPQTSDIQRLREQIETELTSMRNGLSGLAAGVATHRCIEARYRQLGQLEDELAGHIGEAQAAQFSCQAYIRCLDGD